MSPWHRCYRAPKCRRIAENGFAPTQRRKLVLPISLPGKRHTFTVGKVEPDEAEAKANQVDYILMRMRQGFLHMPPGMDIVTFVEFDGKPPQEQADTESLTLAGLRDRYLDTHRNGSLEQATLDGIELHFKHLARSLGEGFPIGDLSLADLQRHADRRAKMRGLNGKLSPAPSARKS